MRNGEGEGEGNVRVSELSPVRRTRPEMRSPDPYTTTISIVRGR